MKTYHGLHDKTEALIEGIRFCQCRRTYQLASDVPMDRSYSHVAELVWFSQLDWLEREANASIVRHTSWP